MFYPHTGVIVSVSQGAENELVQSTTGIETNQRGLLTVNEDGSTTREGRVCRRRRRDGCPHRRRGRGHRQKKVAESMDSYMKSLPKDPAPDPYADIPVFSTPPLGRADQAGRLNPIKFHESAVDLVAGTFFVNFLRLCHS